MFKIHSFIITKYYRVLQSVTECYRRVQSVTDGVLTHIQPQITDLLEKVLIFVTYMGRPEEKLDPGSRDARHFLFARHLFSENCCGHVHSMGRFALT